MKVGGLIIKYCVNRRKICLIFAGMFWYLQFLRNSFRFIFKKHFYLFCFYNLKLALPVAVKFILFIYLF